MATVQGRMYERVTPDQDLAVSKILHSTSKVLFKPISKRTTSASLPVDENDNFDPDASFSAEDLEIVDSVQY